MRGKEWGFLLANVNQAVDTTGLSETLKQNWNKNIRNCHYIEVRFEPEEYRNEELPGGNVVLLASMYVCMKW